MHRDLKPENAILVETREDPRDPGEHEKGRDIISIKRKKLHKDIALQHRKRDEKGAHNYAVK